MYFVHFGDFWEKLSVASLNNINLNIFVKQIYHDFVEETVNF